MGYILETFIDGQWVDDGLVFATEQEAATYGKESISKRRSMGTSYRTQATDEPINYRCKEGKLLPGAESSKPVNWQDYIEAM